MIHPEQKLLNQMVQIMIVGYGGQIIERFSLDEKPTCRMVLSTIHGPLTIVPYGNWIACQFRDIPKEKLPGLNTHSGKWNFHFPTTRTAKDACKAFEAKIVTLLPKPKEGETNAPKD